MKFEDTLASWLPGQRWYSGTAAIGDLAITAQTVLAAGDPELRHLIVTVAPDGTSGGSGKRAELASTAARYQVVAGIGSDVPQELRRAVIGPAAPGLTAYDAVYDPALARVLLRGMARQETAGALRFAREPGAYIDPGLDGRVLAGEQSNTSLVFGQSAILKVLRRLFPGQNPDLEIPRALARRGSRHVPEPLGWIETTTAYGDSVVLAILSRYLPAARDGWSLAADNLRDAYARQTAGRPAGNGSRRPKRVAGGTGFAGEAFRLGEATAEVHADLAAVFGTAAVPGGYADLATQMISRLEAALDEVPQLRGCAGALRDGYAALAQRRGSLRVQRVHGDYHLGQVLRTAEGWVVLDFEGEPSVPLLQRRARGPALRDVAGMLRSFDYAARHQLLDHPDATELGDTADEWVRRCQAAFCDGYAAAGGADPRDSAVMVRALMLDKAVYEAVYEARHRPSWLQIPLASIART
jgi:maltokinase